MEGVERNEGKEELRKGRVKREAAVTIYSQPLKWTIPCSI